MSNSINSVPRREKRKSALILAVEKAMSLPTERERSLALVDLIRGYKNEYHRFRERQQNEGFERCKTDLVIIREKVKARLEEIFDSGDLPYPFQEPEKEVRSKRPFKKRSNGKRNYNRS